MTHEPRRGGGANPERTAWQRPARPETHEHEHAGQAGRGGTGRHSPGNRVRVHTEALRVPHTCHRTRSTAVTTGTCRLSPTRAGTRRPHSLSTFARRGSGVRFPRLHHSDQRKRPTLGLRLADMTWLVAGPLSVPARLGGHVGVDVVLAEDRADMAWSIKFGQAVDRAAWRTARRGCGGAELNAGYRRPPGRRYRDRIRPAATSGSGRGSGRG